MSATPRQILIAHQGTIPHYRVRFYELLEERRPSDWEFRVVFDTRESERPSIYLEKVDWRAFRFPILDTRTRVLRLGGRRMVWQDFFLRARRYDAVVTDTHLSNLTYPALVLYRLAGHKLLLWGHPKDQNIERAEGVKRASETFKRWYIRQADVFLAYTGGMRAALEAAGYPAGRIVVVNNTIDTVAERAAYERLAPRREALRGEMGLAGRRVLLFVGRLVGIKRIEFMAEAFTRLHAADPSWHLVVVGAGEKEAVVRDLAERLGPSAVTAPGAITDPAVLARWFTAADLYLITGAVGLGPLQAFCYDLPTVTFELPTHGPEIAYLNAANSVILPNGVTAAGLAEALPGIAARFAAPPARAGVYESVRALTLENMVDQFIRGVNLALSGAGR